MKKKSVFILAVVVILAILSVPVSFVVAGPPPLSGSMPPSCVDYLHCGWTLTCLGDAVRCFGDLRDPLLMY